MRVFSFGGGVQSVAVMVLQATKQIQPYDAFVFANVGDDSENPATIQYYHEYVLPFAEEFEIKLVEVQKTYKGGKDTILQALERDGRCIPIPVFMPSGAPGRRTCTGDFKIEVVDKWIKAQRAERVVVGLGISLDEAKRKRDEEWTDMKGSKRLGFWRRREHVLIDMRLRRYDCERLIREAGLPVPPKSSCWFCPFHHPARWIDLKREQPELFNKAIALEDRINEKRQSAGCDQVYLHQWAKPLITAVGDQMSLFEADCVTGCDSGYCHT